MIGYLEGRIIEIETDGLLLLSGNIGYEIMASSEVLESLKQRASDDTIFLYIYYHQTERQPKPVLIGFNTKEEKAFFQLFITVDAIGPLKAVKAMEKPVGEIAAAIEQKDEAFLSGLKGIGKRTAQKIIAALHGKTGAFEFHPNGMADGQSETDASGPASLQTVVSQVLDVLVQQLGHTPSAAKKMISEALERDPSIKTPEALFDEIYQEGRP